ncbi:MAG: MBL fold metallo-hydrolase [Chloroflexi bacterium]|nr:MBL fold metallo-hydrolase [Chloroflexota bacterium]
MEITWLGHSCFRLRGRNVSVLTDPYSSSCGYTLGRVSADVVTISNSHPHHNAANQVGGSPVILDGPGEYEVKGVVTTGFRTDVPKRDMRALRNTAFIFEVDDVTVCHLGDVNNLLTAEQIELSKEVNVLLVPVGGHCTIAPAQAAEVIAQIEPKVIIPMHYATESSKVDLESVDHFLREMGLTEIEAHQKITVTVSSLPVEPTVTVLQYPQ